MIKRSFAIFFVTASVFAAPAADRFATLDGARIHYQSYGAGKTAVVFIHGWTCDLTFWRFQAPVYQKRRSLLIDLPGHGQSAKPETPYTEERFARAVGAVMSDAGVEKAVLVGHSMGGNVAVTFAGMYPRKAAAIVYVDGFTRKPPADDAEREKRAAGDAAWLKTLQAPDYKTAMKSMIEPMFSSRASPALREEILSKMTSAPQYVAASALQDLLLYTAPAGGIPVPAMAIMVKHAGQPSNEPLLRAIFSNLRVYQDWEGAGHFLMMEQPEKFNAALSAFLDRK
jgi:pimeloyl-ACP methyl ester carboxylesterase